MDTTIAWHVDLTVKPGQLERFRALTAEMVAFTRREPGVLIYARYISADGGTVHVVERYVDSAAAVAHLRAFLETFGERFAQLVERRSFTVYGSPSAELREILDGFGARYLGWMDGFARLGE